MQRSLTLLGRWSSKYDWVARCRAYDGMIDEKKRRKHVRAIEDMADRHAGQFVLLQSKAIQKLLGMTDEEIAALTPEQAAKWLMDGSNGERKARGLPEFTSANKTALAGADGRGPVQIQPVQVTEVVVRSRAELAAAKANLPEGVEILSMQ